MPTWFTPLLSLLKGLGSLIAKGVLGLFILKTGEEKQQNKDMKDELVDAQDAANIKSDIKSRDNRKLLLDELDKDSPKGD